MPTRAIAAIVTTALGLALLFSFKTPAETASALGPSQAVVAPGTSATPAPIAGATRVPTSTPAATTKTVSRGNGTFSGSVVQNPFGQVQVQITIVSGKITAVTALQLPTHGRSGFISQDAGPILQGEALTAQSSNIDLVSGATYTSEAYAQSLQSAIDQANA